DRRSYRPVGRDRRFRGRSAAHALLRSRSEPDPRHLRGGGHRAAHRAAAHRPRRDPFRPDRRAPRCRRPERQPDLARRRRRGGRYRLRMGLERLDHRGGLRRMTLLPPNVSPLEMALEETTARLSEVPVPLRALWDPQTCPAELLPWLAWGVSIDFWDTDWPLSEKRAAIASAIDDQRRKGTRASLREVLDRFDPLIQIVEWWQDRDTMEPHTFRLELPLAIESEVEYDTALVTALLRDIA